MTDPRGDAERFRGIERRPRPCTRLADLTRARYKTPSLPGGTLGITTRWADLVDGSKKGVRRQNQVTYIFGRRSDEFWAVELSNADNRVRVTRVEDNDNGTRIRPESVTVVRHFGAGGAIDLVLSDEWLDASRIRFRTYSYAGQYEAYDLLPGSRTLSVGTASGHGPSN